MLMTLTLCLGVAAVLALWYHHWCGEALKFRTSGYLPAETSWFGKVAFWLLCRLVNFFTVGPIEVIGRENLPASGRVLIVGNHQVQSDFAMVRQAFGRHTRALGAAAQFPGFMGLLASWLGIIPLTYASKEERAAAEQACVKYLGCRLVHTRVGLSLELTLVFLLGLGLAVGVLSNQVWLSLLLLWLVCLVATFKGGEPALMIAPQGALMPDNVLKKEEFRAGAVRIARAAAAVSGEPVFIVPMGLRYKRDPKDAHWTHRFLGRTRSMFLGKRNPLHWNPLFKLDLNELPAAHRGEIERERQAALDEYRHSQVTSYGGVVVIGDPISADCLPADPADAIEQIRLIIAGLLAEAEKH